MTLFVQMALYRMFRINLREVGQAYCRRWLSLESSRSCVPLTYSRVNPHCLLFTQLTQKILDFVFSIVCRNGTINSSLTGNILCAACNQDGISINFCLFEKPGLMPIICRVLLKNQIQSGFFRLKFWVKPIFEIDDAGTGILFFCNRIAFQICQLSNAYICTKEQADFSC